MQAEQAPTPALTPGSSQISIKFGEFSANASNSINLTLNADYCSSKIDNKRFNTGEYLGKEIPANSLLLELEAKEDGEELAKKLNQIRKKSESMKQLEENNDAKIVIVGKDKKVYINFISAEIEQMIQGFNATINTQGIIQQEERWLEVQIKSNSSFSRLKDLMEKNGTVPAFFQSLSFLVKFNKTPSIKELVKKIIQGGFGEPLSKQMVDSFQFINLNVQFQSASALQSYPELFKKFKLLEINDDFKSIQPLLGNKLQAFLFGKPLSFSASLTAEDLYLALDLLFA